MPECQNCESHISQDYVRVFGDNQGRVHQCKHCPEDTVENKRGIDYGHVGDPSGFQDVTGGVGD